MIVIGRERPMAEDEMTPDELLARLHRIPSVDLANLSAADLIREGREERTDQILDTISHCAD
jgi:hypothetical protein